MTAVTNSAVDSSWTRAIEPGRRHHGEVGQDREPDDEPGDDPGGEQGPGVLGAVEQACRPRRAARAR